MKKNILAVIAFASFFSCSKKNQTADQIIIGKIWTANVQQPWAEAMAITGDSITAIGSENEILKWKGDKTDVTRYDSNRLIVPGFIDTHTHFVEAGFGLS